MANPTNTIDLLLTQAAFLATGDNALIFQTGKVDKTGGAVDAAGIRSNAGKIWPDGMDDLLLALLDFLPDRIAGSTTSGLTFVVIGDAITAVPDGSHVAFTVEVFGKVGANDFVYQRFEARAENNAGTVQLDIDSATAPEYSTGGTLSSASSQLAINGIDIEVAVLGELATNISWQAITRQTVGFAP